MKMRIARSPMDVVTAMVHEYPVKIIDQNCILVAMGKVLSVGIESGGGLCWNVMFYPTDEQGNITGSQITKYVHF